MNQPPTFLSVFAGVGGFDLGLERSGWECAGQIEVDPFCTKVLERHWPHVRRWSDIRDVTFAPPAGEQLAQRPDLLAGGFPCQDLSSAGRRAGITAPRSGLFFQFVRLAAELQPPWVLLENVDQLLVSHGGRDFGAVLGALAELGYGLAWRVLDARWFGLAQRRARVFLVGRLGAPCPAEVLFEPPGLSGHPEAGTAAPPEAVASAADGAPGDGGGGPVAFNHTQDPVNSRRVVPTLGTDGMGMAAGGGVRRLTPTEYERLQGFPDGWTCLCGEQPYSTWACRCPDGSRYEAGGNAVAVPVVEWIGRRLLAAR